MAIDLSSYYNSLHTVSSNLTNAIHSAQTSNSTIQVEDNKADASSFEMAFLAMINQSQDAYKVMEQKAAEGGMDVDITDSTNVLSNDISNILDNYDAMRATNVIPKSIKESLLETLNGNSQSDSSFSSDLLSDSTVEQLIYHATSSL